MSTPKAIILDYIGTLVDVHAYSMEVSMVKLHHALVQSGFKTDTSAFLCAYKKSHEKYREVRYKKLVEITNATWVSEALNELGYNVKVDDPDLKLALNIFFKDYIETLKLRLYAKTLLRKLQGYYRVGLVSNFTYSPVVYTSLRKLGISGFFDAIVVSHDVGWRKPHRRIFTEVLERLHVNAEEAVFVGDSPMEDVEGAQEAGMKSIFVASQFYSIKDLQNSKAVPSAVCKNLKEVYRCLLKKMRNGSYFNKL